MRAGTSLVPVGYLCHPRDERWGRVDTPVLLSVSATRGVVPRSEITDAEPRADDLGNYKRAYCGDLVVNRMSAYQGALGLVTRDGVVSPDYLVLVPAETVEPRWLRCLFRSDWFVGAMTALVRGIGSVDLGSARTPRINWDDLRGIQVPVPALPVQQAVADYLDAEMARIDSLVARLIEANTLLTAWLGARIESMVWSAAEEVVPLMRLCADDRQIQYGIVLPGPDVDEGVPIVKGGDLLSGVLWAQGLAKTTFEIEAGFARSRLRAGDLAFAIRGAAGACAIVPPDVAGANITQDVAMIAHIEDVDPTWLWFALRSHSVQSQTQARVLGATIKGINIRDLKRLKLPRLDLRAQREIASELVLAQGHHDGLVAARTKQINLLKERRQTLITEAVTGDIEIPGVAA